MTPFSKCLANNEEENQTTVNSECSGAQAKDWLEVNIFSFQAIKQAAEEEYRDGWLIVDISKNFCKIINRQEDYTKIILIGYFVLFHNVVTQSLPM